MPGTDAGADSGTGGDTGSGGGELATNVMASAIAMGAVQMFMPMRGDPVVLGRDAMGYYAMSGVCTHESCPVAVMAGASTIGCSCPHGSAFSLTGALMSAATTRPIANQASLQHKRMEIRGGLIVVFPSDNVANTTRVMA